MRKSYSRRNLKTRAKEPFDLLKNELEENVRKSFLLRKSNSKDLCVVK